MRNLRSPLMVLAAALYVLIGVSAAWHAPHFSRDVAAVDVDRHEHHEAVGADECALCPFKNPSVSVAGGSSVAFTASVAPAQSSSTESVIGGFHGAARARAPPLRS